MHTISCANVKSGMGYHSRMYHSALSGPSRKNAHLNTIPRGTDERYASLKNSPVAPARQKPKISKNGMAIRPVKKATALKAAERLSFSFSRFSCEVTNEKLSGSVNYYCTADLPYSVELYGTEINLHICIKQSGVTVASPIIFGGY